MRYDSYAGGPADAAFALMVDVGISWRDSHRVLVIAGYLVGSDRVFPGFLPRHSIDISWRVNLICAF